eukprot:gene29092-38153_t
MGEVGSLVGIIVGDEVVGLKDGAFDVGRIDGEAVTGLAVDGAFDVGRIDGEAVTGLAVGKILDGFAEGERDGMGEVGTLVGIIVGDEVVGLKEGRLLGRIDGEAVTGLAVGIMLDGFAEGERVGLGELGTLVTISVSDDALGFTEGSLEGDLLGNGVGRVDGKEVTGVAVGVMLGDRVEGKRVGLDELGALVSLIEGDDVVGFTEGSMEGDLLGNGVGRIDGKEKASESDWMNSGYLLVLPLAITWWALQKVVLMVQY